MKFLLLLCLVGSAGCATNAALVASAPDGVWVNVRSQEAGKERFFYCTPKGDGGKPQCVTPQYVEPPAPKPSWRQ